MIPPGFRAVRFFFLDAQLAVAEEQIRRELTPLTRFSLSSMNQMPSVSVSSNTNVINSSAKLISARRHFVGQIKDNANNIRIRYSHQGSYAKYTNSPHGDSS